MEARDWPGFPVDPINPNPIHVDFDKMNLKKIRADIPPLGGRRTRRGGPPKYVSLSNYNNIP